MTKLHKGDEEQTPVAQNRVEKDIQLTDAAQEEFCYAEGDEGSQYCGDPKRAHCAVLGDAITTAHLVECMRSWHLIHHLFVPVPPITQDGASPKERNHSSGGVAGSVLHDPDVVKALADYVEPESVPSSDTQSVVEEIRERRAMITEPPYVADVAPYRATVWAQRVVVAEVIEGDLGKDAQRANAHFFANAPTDIDRLLSIIDSPLNLKKGGAFVDEVYRQVLLPAVCGIPGHFWFQENGGHCMMCQRERQSASNMKAAMVERVPRLAEKIVDSDWVDADDDFGRKASIAGVAEIIVTELEAVELTSSPTPELPPLHEQ